MHRFAFSGFSSIKNGVRSFVHMQAQKFDQSLKITHSASVRSSRVYGFGVTTTGAIGIKKFVEPEEVSNYKRKFFVAAPTHLKYFSDKSIDVKTISCGYGFTIFIGSHYQLKRAVYGCGINSDGQLGFQTNQLHGIVSESVHVDVVPEPRVIPIPCRHKAIPLISSCGRAHSLIAYQNQETKEPILFSLGNNTFGQCAREIIEGEIYASKNPQVTQVLLPQELNIISQVECGQDHSLVLSNEGQVFSAGLATDGQTGLGSTRCVDRLTRVGGNLNNMRIKQVSSRGDTVLALTECGRIFAWGNNEYGQVWPVIDEVQVLEPVELPVHQCLTDVKLGKIIQVAAAGSMCCVLDEHGHVLVWGFGGLGLGPKALQALKPTLIPPALFSPALPFSNNKIVDIVPGLHHFLARSNRGLLWSWGASREGLACLGLGHNSADSVNDAVKNIQTYPVPLSLPAEALQVACGVDHTIVLAKQFI